MDVELNYVIVDIEGETADLVEAEYQGDRTIGDIVRWMFDRGLIDRLKARNLLLKQFYIQQVRHQSVTESVLDCAVNFNISSSAVKAIIYDYRG